MQDFAELRNQLEQLVRAGRDADARKALEGLNLRQLPREFRRDFANLCLRTGLVRAGLKILFPVVRPGEQRKMSGAIPLEKAEYALLLQRNGSVAEALRLLGELNPRELPVSLFYRALCHFNRWEYAEAIPLLRTYLESDLEPYRRTVTRLNLAAALIIESQIEEARPFLASLREEARAQSLHRVASNCAELSAQIAIRERRWEAAEAELEEASRLAPTANGLDALFVRKWRAVLSASRQARVTPLEQFMLEAHREGDGESVREAHLFALQIQFDEAKFRELWFGTPFLGYRRRIAEVTGQQSDEATFRRGSSDGQVIDLTASGSEVAPAKILAVLAALQRDFFRRPSLGALFAEIFPGEYFDVESSPNRVQRLLSRTRQWAREQGHDFLIREENGFYEMHARSTAFRLPAQPLAREAHEPHWLAASRYLRTGEFVRSAELRGELGLTPSSFKRFVRWAVENGRLQAHGQGSGVLYRLKIVA